MCIEHLPNYQTVRNFSNFSKKSCRLEGIEIYRHFKKSKIKTLDRQVSTYEHWTHKPQNDFILHLVLFCCLESIPWFFMIWINLLINWKDTQWISYKYNYRILQTLIKVSLIVKVQRASIDFLIFAYTI